LTARPVPDWDPRDPSVLTDRRQADDRMRERCPVAYSEFLGWSLFRYDDVLRAASDPRTFSNATKRHPIPNGWDPPEHTLYRRSHSALIGSGTKRTGARGLECTVSARGNGCERTAPPPGTSATRHPYQSAPGDPAAPPPAQAADWSRPILWHRVCGGRPYATQFLSCRRIPIGTGPLMRRLAPRSVGAPSTMHSALHRA
jgi:hypothetical protein